MQNLSVNFTRKTFGMLNILHFIKKEAFCQKNLNKSICISTLGKWYSKKGYIGLVAKAFFFISSCSFEQGWLLHNQWCLVMLKHDILLSHAKFNI